ETQAWSKGAPVGREHAIRARALNPKALRHIKERQILVAVVKWTKVFPAQAEVKIEISRDLPGVLEMRIHGIHAHGSLGVSPSESGAGHVASEEVCQRQGVAESACRTQSRASQCGAAGPRSPTTVERKSAASPSVVELVHIGEADFRAKAKL